MNCISLSLTSNELCVTRVCKAPDQFHQSRVCQKYWTHPASWLKLLLMHSCAMKLKSWFCLDNVRRDRYEKHVKLYWVEKKLQGRTLILASIWVRNCSYFIDTHPSMFAVAIYNSFHLGVYPSEEKKARNS